MDPFGEGARDTDAVTDGLHPISAQRSTTVSLGFERSRGALWAGETSRLEGKTYAMADSAAGHHASPTRKYLFSEGEAVKRSPVERTCG